MTVQKTDEPAWKKFTDFEGPDEDVRTRALRAQRAREGHGGNTFMGGDLRNGTPRTTKYGRAQRVGDVRIK